MPNYLLAWDGVTSVPLGDAVWGYVIGIGTWQGRLVVSGLMTLPGQPGVETVALEKLRVSVPSKYTTRPLSSAKNGCCRDFVWQSMSFRTSRVPYRRCRRGSG